MTQEAFEIFIRLPLFQIASWATALFLLYISYLIHKKWKKK